MTLIAVTGRSPVVDGAAWVAPTATVIGNVTIGRLSSVFYGAVLRGDRASITVGNSTNLQDNVVVHADPGFRTTIGNSVTVGHAAVLHGCTIEDACLIGIGAIVLNGAVIGAGSLVGAGAVVLGGTVVGPGSLVLGAPARVRRALDEDESASNLANAERYVELIAVHRAAAEIPQ